MEINLADAIQFLRPNSQFVFTDDDYSTIEWHVLDGEPPTQSEIAAALEQVKANKIAEAEAKAANRAQILDRLGLTEEEAVILLG